MGSRSGKVNRSMRCKLVSVWLLAAGIMAAFPGVAASQVFSLDDNPSNPLHPGTPGGGFGLGAEDPFGMGTLGGSFGGSPSLALTPIAGNPFGDGALLEPGPLIEHPGVGQLFVAATSTNHRDQTGPVGGPPTPLLRFGVQLSFSVDRATQGALTTGVRDQSAKGQAPGDIFVTTSTFNAPVTFRGRLGQGMFPGESGTYSGDLPLSAAPSPGNRLRFDDSDFGLLAAGAVTDRTSVVAAPSVGMPAMHDSIDGFDFVQPDATGNGIYDANVYFSMYPDSAVAAGVSAADIFVAGRGQPSATTTQYATATQLGLVAADSIDALVMFDNSDIPFFDGGGNLLTDIEPVTDYALFSLAPGSPSLSTLGLSAGDVFFSDFSGNFARFGRTGDLGLLPGPGGAPGTDNIDALEFEIATNQAGAGGGGGGGASFIPFNWTGGPSMTGHNGDGTSWNDPGNYDNEIVPNTDIADVTFDRFGTLQQPATIHQDNARGEITSALAYLSADVNHTSDGTAHHLPGRAGDATAVADIQLNDNSHVTFDQPVAADGPIKISLGGASSSFNTVGFSGGYATAGFPTNFIAEREHGSFPPSGFASFDGPISDSGNISVEDMGVGFNNTTQVGEIYATNGAVDVGPLADVHASELRLWDASLSFGGGTNPLNLSEEVKSWGGTISKFEPGTTSVTQGVYVGPGNTIFQQGVTPGETSVLAFDGALNWATGGTAAFEVEDPANHHFEFTGATHAHPDNGLIPYGTYHDQVSTPFGNFSHAKWNSSTMRIEAFDDYKTTFADAGEDDAVRISGTVVLTEPASFFAVLFGVADVDIGGQVITTTSIAATDFNSTVRNGTLLPAVVNGPSGAATAGGAQTEEPNELVILLPAQNDRLTLDNVDIPDVDGAPTILSVGGTRGRLILNSAQSRTGDTYLNGVALELQGAGAGVGSGLVRLNGGADITLQNNTLTNDLRITPTTFGFLSAVQADGASTLSGDVEIRINGANDMRVNLSAPQADDHLRVGGTFTRGGSGNEDLGQGLAAVSFGQPFDQGLIEILPSADLTDPAVLSSFGSSVGRSVINDGQVGDTEVLDNITLMGDGSYGSVRFRGGGSTVAPGQSLGTTTINGDMIFGGTDNTYAAEIDDAGNSDLLDIAGRLDLASASDVLELDFFTGNTLAGTYTLATYGEIDGVFDSVRFEGELIADPLVEGAFAGTHQLIYGTTTLWLSSGPIVLPGDYNQNGIVDAADYTVWQDTFGSTTELAADGDGDGTIDAGDYDLWKMNFGAQAASGSQSAVPEPNTCSLLLMLIIRAAGCVRPHARSRRWQRRQAAKFARI